MAMVHARPIDLISKVYSAHQLLNTCACKYSDNLAQSVFIIVKSAYSGDVFHLMM